MSIVAQRHYAQRTAAGLALTGHYLNVYTLRPVSGRLAAALPVKSGMADSGSVRCYLGPLAQCKSDINATANSRGDVASKQSQSVAVQSSSPTPREHMDLGAAEVFDFAARLIERLLAGQRPDYGFLYVFTGYPPAVCHGLTADRHVT